MVGTDKISEEPSKTSAELSKTSDAPSETSSKASKTPAELSKTSDASSKTSGDGSKTSGEPKGKRVKRSYTGKFKLETIELAKSVGYREAARQISTPESNIRRWRKAEDLKKSQPPKKMIAMHRHEVTIISATVNNVVPPKVVDIYAPYSTQKQ